MPSEVDWDDLAFQHDYLDDKAMLLDLHHNQRLSQKQIGYKLNLCNTTVGRRLKFHNIKAIRYYNNPSTACPRLPKKGV